MSNIITTERPYFTAYSLDHYDAMVSWDAAAQVWQGTVDGDWHVSGSREQTEQMTRDALIEKVEKLKAEEDEPPRMWAIRRVSDDYVVAWVPEWIAARMMATSLMQADKRQDLYVRDHAERVQ